MVDKGRYVLLSVGLYLCFVYSSLYASYPEALNKEDKPSRSAAAAAAAVGAPLLRDDHKPDLKNPRSASPLLQGSAVSPLLENPAERAPYQALAEKIIALTGATHDVRREVQERLTHTLFPQIKENGALGGGWRKLWGLALDPEALIGKETLFSKGAEEGFRRLNETLKEIDSFKQTLLQVFPHEPSIQRLDHLKDFYHSFKDQCLEKLDVLRREKSDEALNQFNLIFDFKALLMGELWPHQFFRISQSMSRHLLRLDEHGHNLSSLIPESTSSHRVSFLPIDKNQERQIFFKNEGSPSLNPSREYMLTSLYRRLDIQVPLTCLLVLDHVKFGETYCLNPYFIQASEAIQGLSGKAFLKENSSFLIDEEHFSRQVIGALLTSPLDGKLDNFIVTSLGKGKYGWVSIDNDEVFEPPLHGDSIHLKSILFLLPLMDKLLSEKASSFLRSFVSSKLILEWLRDLENQEERYKTFKKDLTSHYFCRKGKTEDSYHIDTLWENLKLPFKSFASTLIPTLQSFLIKIQMTLTEPVTYNQVFITCYPALGSFYQNLREKYTPYEALKLLYPLKGGCATLPSELGSQSLENRYYEDSEEEKLIRNNNPHLLREEITKYLSSLPLRTLSSSAINDIFDLIALHWRSLAPQLRSLEWQEPRHLINYVQRGSLPCVIEMMVQDRGISIHTQDENNRTLLHLAPGSTNEGEKISALIVLGADLEALDKLGLTPLDIAAERKKEEAFTTLIEEGAGKKANIHKILSYSRELSDSKREALYPFLRVTNPKLAWEIALEALYSTSIRDTLIKVVGEGNKYLPASLKKDIFDNNGKILKTNKHGKRAVPHLKRGVYETHLKLYPELPGMEIAVSTLIRALGYEAPYSKLAELRGLPVLLTQTIPGETLFEVLHSPLEKQKDIFQKLDPYHLSMAFVMAMVMNPEDGSPTNYIVSPYRTQEGEERYKIISIDHDHSFMPAVAKEIKGPKNEKKKSLQVKSVLYCMDEMDIPVHVDVISHFKALNPMDILKPWVDALKAYDALIKSQFNGDMVLKLLKDKDTVIGVPFSPGMVGQLYTKLIRLQMALAKDIPTHFDLLSILEPQLGHRYKSAYQRTRTLSVWERFENVDGIFYNIGANNSLSSTASLEEVLDSSSIPDKQTLQAALWKNTYGPLQALEEAQILEKEYTSYEQIIRDLKATHPQKFKDFKMEGLQEKLLQQIDFNDLSIEQQRVFLKSLQGKGLRVIRLHNANGLDGALLRELGSAHSFTHLRHFSLSGCEGFENFSFFKLFTDNQPFIMPMLQVFEITSCSRLKEIRLDAPLLERMRIISCNSFRTLDIKSPHLRRVHLKALKEFDEEGMMVLLRTHQTLQALKIEECSRIPLSPKLPFNLGEYQTAQSELKEAVKGNSLQQFNLGVMYAYGRGVTQDYVKAREWYEKAAAQNNTLAQCSLGIMYHYGYGVPQDYVKAQEWYEKVAAQNDVAAQCSLGVMYLNGQGVTQDSEKALQYFHQSKILIKGKFLPFEAIRTFPLRFINDLIIEDLGIEFDEEVLNFYADKIYPLLSEHFFLKFSSVSINRFKNYFLNFYAQYGSNGPGDYYLSRNAGFSLKYNFLSLLCFPHIEEDSKTTSLICALIFCGPLEKDHLKITRFDYNPYRAGLPTLLFDYFSAKFLGEIFVKYYKNIERVEFDEGNCTPEGAATFRQFIPFMKKIKYFRITEVEDLVTNSSYDVLIPNNPIDLGFLESLAAYYLEEKSTRLS